MPKRWLMFKAGVLVFAMVAAATVLAVYPVTPSHAGPAASANPCGQQMDSSASTGTADDGLVDPEAACKIRPECDSNSDCDDICGPGLGRCVHNKCPIRICRCN